MYCRKNYLPQAKANEAVFRNILRDLKNNSEKRPNGLYVPEDIETEASIDDIFAKYTLGSRFGIFTILDFTIENGEATIDFENVACLSGGGACLRYSISGEAVSYLRADSTMMS